MERLFVVVSAALFLLASGACQTDDADQDSATKTDKTVPEVRATLRDSLRSTTLHP